MNPLPAIFIFDRDILFREALRNFLLAAGYSQVEVAVTVQEALTRMRGKCYGYILIGLSQPFSRGQRLAAVAKRHQPGVKILFLVSADDQPLIQDTSFEYIIKEYGFSSLLELM